MRPIHVIRWGLLAWCLIAGPVAQVRAAEPADPSQNLAPGTFRLAVREDRVWLDAREVPVQDLLTALEAEFRVRIDSGGGLEGKEVTGTYAGVSLDRLMQLFNLNYVLTYVVEKQTGRHILERADLFAAELSTGDYALDERIRNLIRDLFDDDIRWNAHEAVQELKGIGAPVIPFMEQLLQYGDEQAQLLAVLVLVRLGDAYAPDARFLEKLVANLHHDGYPFGGGRILISNARMAVDYLRSNPDQAARATPMLTQGLASEDGQQRFLSALLLAENGARHLASRIAPILIAHLKDNRLSSDANNAAYALAQLGTAARPYLLRALNSVDAAGDPQLASYAARLIEQIDAGRAVHFKGARSLVMHDWGDPARFPRPDGSYLPPLPVLPPPAGRAMERSGPIPSSPEHLLYIVRRGDTLASVGRLFIKAPQDLAEFNGLSPDAELTPGQPLRIPSFPR